MRVTREQDIQFVCTVNKLRSTQQRGEQLAQRASKNLVIRKETLTGFAEGIDRSAVSGSAPIALMVGRFKVVRNTLENQRDIPRKRHYRSVTRKYLMLQTRRVNNSTVASLSTELCSETSSRCLHVLFNLCSTFVVKISL